MENSTGCIPIQFWDTTSNKWDSHSFFKTKEHWHISDYSDSENCDLMIVECEDGRFFIEDNWGTDAKGHTEVFNPYHKGSYPKFFESFSEVNQRAAEIVSSITGSSIEEIKLSED